MGFNFSGIVIGKSYKNNLDELFRELKLNATFSEEVSFEEATSNWKEAGICDVYCTESSTLLFLETGMCTEPWILKDNKVVTFVISEISMTFYLAYTENGALKRSILEAEGNRISEQGEPLAIEAEASDTSELVWLQMEEVLGQQFWDIDLEETALRYRI